jgi:thymidylate kinase
VTVVSFSGIDGAGKSTQISELQFWLSQCGLATKLVTFWDDVVVFSGLREFMSHRAFKGDQGIGSPDNPLQRRDKNVTSWPVTLSRFFFYLFDAVSLALKVRSLKKTGADVVIFDRYIYDELANLPLQNNVARAFIRSILKLGPKPDVACVIDADPAAAVARKPEYPLDFVERNREAYLTLSELAGNIAIIEPGSVETMQSKIRMKVMAALPAQRRQSPYADPQRVLLKFPINRVYKSS